MPEVMVEKYFPRNIITSLVDIRKITGKHATKMKKTCIYGRKNESILLLSLRIFIFLLI